MVQTNTRTGVRREIRRSATSPWVAGVATAVPGIGAPPTAVHKPSRTRTRRAPAQQRESVGVRLRHGAVGRRASVITKGDTSRNDKIVLLLHTMCSLMADGGVATPSAAAVADAKREMLNAASNYPLFAAAGTVGRVRKLLWDATSRH
jgi:hypothetical protein